MQSGASRSASAASSDMIVPSHSPRISFAISRAGTTSGIPSPLFRAVVSPVPPGATGAGRSASTGVGSSAPHACRKRAAIALWRMSVGYFSKRSGASRCRRRFTPPRRPTMRPQSSKRREASAKQARSIMRDPHRSATSGVCALRLTNPLNVRGTCPMVCPLRYASHQNARRYSSVSSPSTCTRNPSTRFAKSHGAGSRGGAASLRPEPLIFSAMSFLMATFSPVCPDAIILPSFVVLVKPLNCQMIVKEL